MILNFIDIFNYFYNFKQFDFFFQRASYILYLIDLTFII